MKPFTYKDYLYYKKQKVRNLEEKLNISQEFYNRIYKISNKDFSENALLSGNLQEEKEEYLIEEEKNLKIKKEINQIHDKTYKTILSNKKEVVKLINSTLNFLDEKYQIKEDEIEKYNSSFITKSLKNRESDVIYRMKEKEVFFLIEQQSKIDNMMPYRILEYCMLIMEDAIDKRKAKTKGYKYPKVYPIVLYTGKNEWKEVKRIEECQEKLEGIEEQGFSQYSLIDINKYTKEELLEKEGILSKILILEKTKTEKELVKDMKDIVKTKMTKEEKELLEEIVYRIFANNIEKEKIEGIMKKLESKEEQEMVIEEVLKKSREREFNKGKKIGLQKGRELGVSEGRKIGISEGRKLGVSEGRKIGVNEGREIGIQEGRKEEKNKIIIEMIRNEVGDNIIMKIVNINEEELEKIKKKLNSKEIN